MGAVRPVCHMCNQNPDRHSSQMGTRRKKEQQQLCGPELGRRELIPGLSGPAVSSEPRGDCAVDMWPVCSRA